MKSNSSISSWPLDEWKFVIYRRYFRAKSSTCILKSKLYSHRDAAIQHYLQIYLFFMRYRTLQQDMAQLCCYSYTGIQKEVLKYKFAQWHLKVFRAYPSRVLPLYGWSAERTKGALTVFHEFILCWDTT